MEQETIVGRLRRVIFRNDDSKYTVGILRVEEPFVGNATIVGKLFDCDTTRLRRFYGAFVENAKYGRQFHFDRYEEVLPSDPLESERVLASPYFSGIGLKTARYIVASLGNDCLRRIKENPALVDGLKIKKNQKDALINGIEKLSGANEAVGFLLGVGLDTKIILRLEELYGAKTLEILKNNPYDVLKDADNISFEIADRIGRYLGVSRDDPRRISALLSALINKICYDNQDTYTEKGVLYAKLSRETGDISEEIFTAALNKALADETIVEENNRLFPKKLYEAETKIARYLARYIRRESIGVPAGELDAEIASIEKSRGIDYSADQIAAIKGALNNNLTIITGGPGTGKTTIIDAVATIYQRFYPGDKIVICAPTGRASKRLSELANKEARTIHRALGWDLDSNSFAMNAAHPLEGDFLIVDEFSMVDCQLFYHLLDATRGFQKILLIGDEAQLPPVSPGDVLRDLLRVPEIYAVALSEIHRQNEDSGIIPLCYDVRRGELHPENLKKKDVFFLSCSASDAATYVLRVVDRLVNEGYNQQDIQVLAPMYDGRCGIDALNAKLRDYFNPASDFKDEISIFQGDAKVIYRVGDKILQLKNQTKDDVYNGDIGVLEAINKNAVYEKGELVVNFDGNYVTYPPKNFDNIRHAYCVSVHKSQGSEYKKVIMPILVDYRSMLKKKLIYTGTSRAKESLYLLGDLNLFVAGIKKGEAKVRRTTLKERINDLIR